MEVSTRPPLVDGKLGLPLHSSSSAEPEDDFTLSVDESDIFPDEERESPKSPVNDSRLRFKHSVINGSTSTTREIEVKRAGCELDSDSALCNGEVVRESVPDSATVFRTENASEVEETEVLLNPGESHGRTEGSSCTVSFNSDAENSSSRNANAAADENDKSPTQKRDDESPRQILNSQSIAECEEVLGARQKEEEVINTGNCEAADRNEGFHATQLNNGANCSNDIMGKITNTKSIRDGKERSGVQDSISNTAPSDDGLDEYESGSIQVIDISSLPHALRAMNTDDHLMLDESSSLADDHDGIVQTGGDEEVVEANDCARSVETEDGEAKILKVKGAIEVAQHLVEDGVNKGTAQGNEPMAEEIDEDEEQLPSVVGVESLAPASSLKTAESSVDAGGVETFTVAGDSGLAKELADAVGSCDEPVDGGGIKPADGGDETLAAVSDATVSDAVESDKVLASNEDAIGEPMLSANCKDVESVESAEGRGDEPVSDTTEALDDEGSVAADQGSVADHHMEADQDINAAASEDDNGEPVVSTHQKDVESGETTDGGEPAADTTEAPEDEGSVGADDGSTADYDTEVDQGDEQGSPDYQGMPDDILPIIESELDDIPVGGEGLFDTEVEGVDDTQDGDNSSTSPHQNDLAGDGEVSLMVSEDSRLVEDDGTTKKKKLLEKFSSNHRQKLKRRASEDLTQYSPPLKILKRQSSLDHMDDIAGRDTTKTLQEFKTLLLNEPPKAPAGIVTEPLDIPIEFDLFKKGASKPAKDAGEEKRKHATSIGDGQSSTVTERLLETEDQSVLVIDLDDDDDKQDIVQPKVEKTSKLEEALRQPPPRNAMDALFKGKEEITLNRKTFSKLVKSFASQYLFTVGDFGKVARLSLQADDVLTKMQASSSSFDKQKDDFKAIMTKLIDDRKEKKTWDESLAPPKVTRSVGLQVCSVGSMYVSNSMEAEGTGILNRYATPNTPVTSTNQNQALAQQKLAYAQQQLAMAQQNKVKHPVDIRPTAKKSITAPKRPLTNRSLQPTPISAIKSGKVNGQQVQITNKLNGFSKALTVSRNPPERPQPVTVTTVSPNSKTFTLTSNRTYAKVITSTSHKSNNLTLARPVSQPIQPRVTKTIAIPAKPVSTLGTMTGSNVVPVAVSHTLNSPLQGSRNLASGPGRPMIKPPPPKAQNTINISPAISTSPADRGMQNSTPADKRKITSDSSLIDLTEMDDEVPQPTKSAKTSSTAKKSTTPRAISIQKISPNRMNNRGMGIPAKILSGSIPIGPKPLRHPALPPNPPHFNVLTAPPKPYLGICDTQKVTQGIMLTWHFQNVIPQRKISKFQVFAYQESKSEGDDSWKKVGDVDSLPLPMACTLTQFREGYTYHFIVRAVDETGNIGPFSAPNTITLMKKVS